jgi:1,3-beta-glucanosyltransferase GAS5
MRNNNSFWCGGGSSKLTDPIADTTACKRDVEEFKKLGINTVRIYTIDNSASHDDCMKILADAGIYLALDVNSPQYSLNRQDSYAIAASYNDVGQLKPFLHLEIPV